ncbi:MAG: RNase adapter RapZ [Deltaproteobacteria bacterium]|nr:RNase adapter RapZ [Deltaproteobacteria bacterium]
MKNIRVVIVTGLSGSGKSTALKALEDIGFFCVDNLPVMLLPKLLELQAGVAGEISKIALGMDVRERYFLSKHIDVISTYKKKKYDIEILFLDASDDSLIRRFSETRRSHPLTDEGRAIPESIKLEREILHDLKELATAIIDTTHYNVHQLKEHVQRLYLTSPKEKKLAVNLISFGYRYGIPSDADIVMDVRFLPNPYYVQDLKRYDGTNKKVEDYVLKWEETKHFMAEILKLFQFLMPLYEKEGKYYLTITVGCTGGKHRSVVIINQLARNLAGGHYAVTVVHRDIDR